MCERTYCGKLEILGMCTLTNSPVDAGIVHTTLADVFNFNNFIFPIVYFIKYVTFNVRCTYKHFTCSICLIML